MSEHQSRSRQPSQLFDDNVIVRDARQETRGDDELDVMSEHDDEPGCDDSDDPHSDASTHGKRTRAVATKSRRTTKGKPNARSFKTNVGAQRKVRNGPHNDIY
jgi:hypothetical protein